MHFADEHSQLRKRFEDMRDKTIPVAWPNVTFTPPAAEKTWCDFNIIDGDTTMTTFGADQNNFRSIGLVVIQIFGPVNKGDGSILALADSIAAMFNNWCGTTVRCRAASIKNIGPDGRGWYQVNVSIPFKRDELI